MAGEPGFDEMALRQFGQQIGRLLMGESLTREETYQAYKAILNNEQPDLQQGAFMAALHGKHANPAELAGVWQAFQEVDINHQTITTPEPFVEIAGTGADSLKTLNISTGAAIIAAAAGAYVAKKGAPAITGKAGTADTFAALGIETMAPLSQVARSVETIGLGFAHAFSAHSAKLGRILSQIRFPSSINIVGPLTNGFNAKRQVLGVFMPPLTGLVAALAKEIGFERVLVPCGHSAEHPDRFIDEYSNIGPTSVTELKADGSIHNYILTPADLGLKQYRYEDIATGDDAVANAKMIADVLSGRDQGAKRDVLCLNAGAVLYLADKAKDIRDGYDKALAAVESGKGLEKLRQLILTQNADPAAGLATLEKLIGSPVATV